jgi:hypothetical protein
VLSVVGNLSQASFACPGLDEPTVLQGELGRVCKVRQAPAARSLLRPA